MKELKTGTIELLAPAGDYECFLAAIKSGADAVYLSGSRFGARAYAANFSQDELMDAIDHAHLYGRKVYLTVNTVLKNKEIRDLYDFIAPLYCQGLDGVIVQDIGVISCLSGYFPDLPIHASTQMAITSSEGVKLLEEMGVTRVVPARELSLDEVKSIYKETGIEIECFIHGALCYSYSGKCLFSSLVGGRSGNRGRCAQPCRLPYNDKYILSARDISTIEILPELMESGICSFKIEGRMKSKEYVAGVTGIYRKYIDRYLSSDGRDHRVDPDDLKELDELYTRSGHCEGYYHMYNGKDMITMDKPSYNTPDDERMLKLYEKYTGHMGKLNCIGNFKAFKDSPISLELDHMGTKVTCTGALPEKALKQPTDASNINKHLKKLGDTPFEFSELKIEAGNDVFIPVSAINSLRREAFSLLKDEMLKRYKRVHEAKDRNENKNDRDYPRNANDDRPFLNIRIDRKELLEKVLESNLADIISINLDQLKDERSLKETADRLHEKNIRLYISLPAVIRNGYLKKYNKLAALLNEFNIDGVIIDNYESLYYLRDAGYHGVILADIHMYCLNDVSVSAYHRLGADILTYPVELNARELNDLALDRGEFILYQRLPMMVSAQCTQKTQDKCLKDNGISFIRDRYGNLFPVVRNCSECYNTVLNCHSTMIRSSEEIPSRIKPYSFRIYFTSEDREEAGRILDFYKAFLEGRPTPDTDIKRTLGHLKRGVE